MTIAGQMANYGSNWVVWVILVLGLCCYLLLFNFIFSPHDKLWQQRMGSWLKALTVLLSALPLLGLLGTIKGLIATFKQMSGSQGLDQQALLSSGIADALITTQLGLVLVVPGLLLLAWLRAKYHRGVNSDA